MKQSWFHLAALGVFVLVGLAWGLVRCGVLGEMPTRIPRNSADLDVLPPEELPKEGVPGFPRRYFEGTGTVVGRLVEQNQQLPWEGTTVRLAARPELETRTTVEGRFELAGIPAGIDVALRIETPGGAVFGISTIAVLPDARVDLGTLVLGGRVRWTGRVTDTEGRPVPGAVVTLHERHLMNVRAARPADLPLHRRPPALYRAVTDAEGRYAIADVTRHDLLFVVRAAGFVPRRGDVSGT
ncbi:MAG: carboxypeptidase regulatory-like domain-containing protein, partial [Planctomycetota bacterium]|nr:carboxypeptidase regulatory-like domain-containing protein [Planctomycetota bacterium]